MDDVRHVRPIAWLCLLVCACTDPMRVEPEGAADERVASSEQALSSAAESSEVGHTIAVRERLREGRRVFRYETFGDEAFWGGKLRLHDAIRGAEHGGVGPGIAPSTALALGLKVDVEALPRKL